jgi:hypothetical protein
MGSCSRLGSIKSWLMANVGEHDSLALSNGKMEDDCDEQYGLAFSQASPAYKFQLS